MKKLKIISSFLFLVFCLINSVFAQPPVFPEGEILLPPIIFAIFIICLNIYCIKFLGIPIISIITGVFTVLLGLIMTDMLYFPVINIIVCLFGIYCILAPVINIRKKTPF